ncbi:MAG: M24 family metallopeptidase [Spirochaetota bacterium]
MKTNTYATSMQQTLADEGVAALILTDTINIRYFSGIHFKHPGSAAMLLFADRPPVVYSGELEYETALNETRVEDIRTYGRQEEYESVLIRALQDSGVDKGAVGFEDRYISVATAGRLVEALPGCRFVPFSAPIAAQRGIKTAEEIALTREACGFAEKAMQRVLDIAKEGMPERELAILGERTMREAGAEDRAFETIFSSGTRTAMCHGFASDKRLEAGDLVMFDLGAVHQGYHSDMTRMATVGEPRKEHRNTFDDLKKVYDVLIAETQAGISVGELLQRGSEAVEKSEYSEAFICGYGRGLGLTLIEEPTLSMDSELILEPGMIITFHPQFYFLHRFGLRLESTVLVTEAGAEVLTPLPMELYRL